MDDLLFRKICRLTGNAIVQYDMIREGDRILAGISGGKDSVALLHVLRHFQKTAPVSFSIEAATFDPGFPGFSADGTGELCAGLGIPHHIIRFDMAALLAEKKLDGSPYSATDAANVRRFQQKLESLGYKKLYDLGGILSWPYEIEGDFEGHF